MSNKTVNTLTFIITLITLIISLVLFWNMGIYVDENNSSPANITGGQLGLAMYWLRLLLLLILFCLSAQNLSSAKR